MTATHQTIYVDSIDQEFSKAVMELLTEAGFQCAVLEEGNDLQEHADTCLLLISDLEVNGDEKLEVLERIQARQPGLPLIVVTHQTSPAMAVRIVELAPAGCCLKPLVPSRLLESVRKAAQSRRLFGLIQTWREKLSVSSWQVGVLEDHMSLSPTRQPASLQSAFLEILFNNLHEELQMLQQLLRSPAQEGDDEERNPTVEHSRPVVLMGALHDAINTLQSTKNSFQSRELGALRRRLQNLVGETPASRRSGSRTTDPPRSPLPTDAERGKEPEGSRSRRAGDKS